MGRSLSSSDPTKTFTVRESWLAGPFSLAQARPYLILLAQITALLMVIKLSRIVDERNNYYIIVLPLLLAAAMLRRTYAASDTAAVRLLQLIGVISGAYALVHYPLFPVVEQGFKAMATLGALVGLWIAAVACGILCLRWPSLGVVGAAYLVWSKLAVSRVTGLWHGHIIDVVPLAEVSFCLLAGLGVIALTARVSASPGMPAAARTDIATAGALFSKVLIAAAISIQLGNYYSSFLAKVTLDAGPTSWLLANDPGKLFSVGLDNNHVFYASWAWLVEGMRAILSHAGPLTNTLILVGQGAALVGILMPRRWLVILLLGFDAMHLSIVVVMGANFAPWILLNLAIGAVVISRHYQRPPLMVGVLSVLFILSDNSFMTQARLGWYDTAANNKLYFQAVDKDGGRHYVPTNFFTFYSYPFAHMAYGSPDAETAFALDNPNGGTQVYRKVVASLSCDVPVLTARDGAGQDLAKIEIDRPAVDAYIRGYHRLVTGIADRLGSFPHAFYPHHFFVPLQHGASFDGVGLHDIVAYIYRRESVCLSLQDGVPVRRLVSEAEHRIDLKP
ncbi:hypothetical protein FV242_00830 [Methylobacterium sp. WL64]|uniref:hypothetical protein n=1 Tax=Methylobacterium sp. WL64 TaxID=2603894 RepID=UPI0011C953FB|nr:hypothetical protein [Methylobacterium sp. WL64]TXN06228.1 hypothetical protein FV242_00830 [Methylobacterium sp. WL64]